MKKPQRQIVLEALEKNIQVTTIWAMNNYIHRLSARIKELRDAGYNIESFQIKNKGKVAPYCGYRLLK